MRIYKKILYSDVYKYFKTGDLLFFSFNDVDIKIRTFIHNRFSHVGMIYKENDDLYIIELSDGDLIKPYDTNTINNVQLVPLEDKIKFYSGNVYYSELLKPLSNTQIHTLNKFLNKSSKYKYTSFLFMLYQFLLVSNTIYGHNRFCTEYIAEILYKLNISYKPYRANKFNINNAIYDLANNDIYTNPIHIIVNDLLIKSINKSNYIKYCD